ncbi:uncharacterized protein [Procambarus clarkii]|uniref:uncharacterized protein n=1 Tax=Procambarus clarkii TaxID=6728 RepID=UPI001E678301|nr:uncharacterized protein LOC123773611 [Procambarus clarkii]
MVAERLEAWWVAPLVAKRVTPLVVGTLLLSLLLTPYLLPRFRFPHPPLPPHLASPLLTSSPQLASPLLTSSPQLASPLLTSLPPQISLTSLPPQTSSSNSSSPSPHKTTRHHPAYDRRCYKYHTNLHAENICCRTANFSGSISMIHQCITKANAQLLKVHRGSSTGGSTTEGGSGGPAARSEHWVVLGDSHMRYLLAAFLTRFRSPTLQYRLRSTDKWSSADVLEQTLHHQKMLYDIEVRDLGVNFHMTYILDIHLTVLPKKLTEWQQQPHRSPTLLVFASALHWMWHTQNVYQSQGPEAAVALYRKHIRSLRHQLTRFAANTPVAFKLLDDLLFGSAPNATDAMHTRSNYPLYNKAALEELSGTGVIIWDSTLPLSRAYTLRCEAQPLHTPPWHHWNCLDRGHVGYILVDQYADMIINDYCNKYLNLGQDFCV